MGNVYKINDISPEARSTDFGPCMKKGSIATVGTDFDFTSKWIHVGIGGDLILQDISGNPHPFLGLSNDSWILVMATKVIESAVIGGDTYTTSCDKITYHGGI